MKMAIGTLDGCTDVEVRLQQGMDWVGKHAPRRLLIQSNDIGQLETLTTRLVQPAEPKGDARINLIIDLLTEMTALLANASDKDHVNST